MWTAAAVAGGAVLGALSADSARSAQNKATDKSIAATKEAAATSRADLAPYRDAGTAALGRLQKLLGLTESGPSTATTGFIPKDKFDSEAYLRANPDVAANAFYGQNPYQHYVDHGMSEGRQGYQGGVAQETDSPLLRKFTAEDLNADPVYNSGLQFGLNEGTKAIERRAAAGGGYDSGAELKALTRFGNDYGSTKAADSRARFVEDQNNQFGRLSGISGMGSGATTVGVNAGQGTASNLSSLFTGQGNADAASRIAGSNSISNGVNNYMQYQLLSQLSGGGGRTIKPDPSLTGAGDLGTVT